MVNPTAFVRVALSPKKVAAMTVVSNETLKFGGPKALELVRRDAVRAAAIATDTAFLGNAAAGARTRASDSVSRRFPPPARSRMTSLLP